MFCEKEILETDIAYEFDKSIFEGTLGYGIDFGEFDFRFAVCSDCFERRLFNAILKLKTSEKYRDFLANKEISLEELRQTVSTAFKKKKSKKKRIKMDEFIREFPTQKVIGVIRTMSNGDQIALSFPVYQQLGIWKKDQNATFEIPSYRKVSTGNTVMQFIYR